MTRLYYDRGDFERWSAQAQQLGYKVRCSATQAIWTAKRDFELVGTFTNYELAHSLSQRGWLDVDDPRVLQ